MYKSSNRIFPLILVIIIAIALIAGLVSIGRYFFAGNSEVDDQQQSVQETARDELLTVDTDRAVRMTVRGPIVGNEDFRSFRIQVSPTNRVYTVYKGYLDSQLSRKSYGNNTEAYEQFVYALDKAALTTPGELTEEQANDIRGVCATGRLYQYEILRDGDVSKRYWTSSCKGSPGTFGASVVQVNNLFTEQIPTKVDFGSSSNRLRL